MEVNIFLCSVIYFSFNAPRNWKCLVMLKDAYNTRRREVPIHYHSDRINKQMSSLPDILIKLRMEINAVLETLLTGGININHQLGDR